MFVLYALLGLLAALAYRGLPRTTRIGRAARAGAAQPNRRASVYTLAALFSLDAFGGGFVVQSMVALWLYQRFGLSLADAGAIFFWTGILIGAVVPRRGAHRQSHRARQHDGVHAPAGEPLPRR